MKNTSRQSRFRVIDTRMSGKNSGTRIRFSTTSFEDKYYCLPLSPYKIGQQINLKGLWPKFNHSLKKGRCSCGQSATSNVKT